ncbi:O-antigen ligase family protein [Paenibacillus stellifer]|uniref:O-antigen ligase family protein n=1 Tax=Paenibacillus stellifer TaxID=169760 RepID=UPI0014702A26|nr:O-antigen ligase family protein [Paenibacillus stellifer]
MFGFLHPEGISAAIIAVVGIAAVLRRGLYFAEDGYLLLAVFFLLCGALLMIPMLRWTAGEMPAGDSDRCIIADAAVKKDGLRLRSADKLLSRMAPGEIGVLAGPFLLAGLYGISLLRHPVSAQGTVNELLSWSACGCFAVLAWRAASRRQSGRLLRAGWHLAGGLLCASGLLAYFRLLPIPYAVLTGASPQVSASGARLGGLLQYPNAFGAAMAVFLLERLFAAASRAAGTADMRRGVGARQGGAEGQKLREGGSRMADAEDRDWWGCGDGAEGQGLRENAARVVGAEDRDWWGCGDGAEGQGLREDRRDLRRSAVSAALRHAPLFPYAAALLLSESRGAWLAAACAAAALLALQRRLALPLLAAGAAPFAAAALLLRGLALLPAEAPPGLGAAAGLWLWAGALAAGLRLSRRAERPGGRKSAALLAALAWTAGCAAVLLLVRARGIGPSSTVGARLIIYRDALRFAAEAPWLGRGGETWHSAYLAIQSSPYAGSQVHSGVLDLLLDLGAAGLTVAAVSLAAAGVQIAIRSPRLLAPFLALLLHASVDFDMSYTLFRLLLLWLPALALAEGNGIDRGQEAEVAPGRVLNRGRRGTLSTPFFSDSASSDAGELRDGLLKDSALGSDGLAFGSARLDPYTPGVSGFCTPVGSSPVSRLAWISTGQKRPERCKHRQPFHSIGRRLGIAGVCVLLIGLSTLSFRNWRGETLFRQAVSASSNSRAVQLAERSLDWNPLSPKSTVVLSWLLPDPGEKREAAEMGLRYSPQDPALSWAVAEEALKSGNPGEALRQIRLAERADRFNRLKWTEAAEGMLKLGEAYLAKGDRIETMRFARTGRELLRQYRLLAEEQEAALLNRRNDRRFRYTAEASGLDEQLKALERAASGLENGFTESVRLSSGGNQTTNTRTESDRRAGLQQAEYSHTP